MADLFIISKYLGSGIFITKQRPQCQKKIIGAALLGLRIFLCIGRQITEEMIKTYLEHHFEPNPADNFKMEDPNDE
jgi:putative transposase